MESVTEFNSNLILSYLLKFYKSNRKCCKSSAFRKNTFKYKFLFF